MTDLLEPQTSAVAQNTVQAAPTAPSILLYSRLRTSPYFWKSRAHGVAMYSVYNHTYHPRHYGDPIAEYHALVDGVTLWDVGVERQLEISGPQAFDFTNYLVPRDLNRCKVGSCKYVFMTAPDGGIINDPVLLRLEDNKFWLSLADSDARLWAMGLAHAGGWDVTIREADVAPVQVQGPLAKPVMTDLFGDGVLDIPYYGMHRYTLDGMDVVVSRTGYTGEVGYEIYLEEATRNASALWDRVWEAGQPQGMRTIGPCHIRRIEGGMLAYGCDITLDTNPMEVGYDYRWMVDLDQEADFVGKQTLTRIREQGVSRQLAGVEIDGARLGSFNDGSMIEAFPVWSDGIPVGRVTSACWSPRLDRNIGMAMLPVELGDIGTELEVVTPDATRRAVVVPKPFIDPSKEIPKG